MGNYFVTRAGARMPAKVRAFREWLKTELPPLTKSRK
jgi:DNA-binding transcriptional LysR family regulator